MLLAAAVLSTLSSGPLYRGEKFWQPPLTALERRQRAARKRRQKAERQARRIQRGRK